ncbi:hypothetical protein [Listeria cornellensis]|uniref:Uncharacterized protein n=1 Tax=Listeria cornellensis FSL F6-0969 TaxID=1265820 RepID=W7C6D3_9LIST|nr:hypothetical protein [Listeria cornellensis]EUJ32765.1 hypothetical protein PCORN_00465 [Listeria cornellensis FSL F6-0969]
MPIKIEQLVINEGEKYWGTPEFCEKLRIAVAGLDADFVAVRSRDGQKLWLQMQDYINRFPENMNGADIHVFNQNPAFLQYLRKLPDGEVYDMTPGLMFLGENTPNPASTYLEQDPHILLAEMGTYILYKTSFLKEYFNLVERSVGLIDIFQKSKMIWKHRVLEETKENEEVLTGYTVDEMVSCWEYYRELEDKYTFLSLNLLDFDKNMFNYLIRNKLGPVFAQNLMDGNLTEARNGMEAFTDFLESRDKKLVSALVSSGYFYIHFPVVNYGLWQQDKSFVVAYLRFLKVLFGKSHYQTKQYYLKYYRRATNATYKTVGLNSIKPVAKSYELYFEHESRHLV